MTVVAQLFKKSAAFWEIERFNSASARVRHSLLF